MRTRATLVIFSALAAIAAIGATTFFGYQQGPRLEFGDTQRDKFTFARFSPDGKTIVAGAADNALKLWDVATGREIRQFLSEEEKGTQRVWGVGFSPDGKRVFACGQDRHLVMWETDNGKQLRSFPGNNGNGVESFALSPDGTQAITSGFGGHELRLWDLKSGKMLKERKWELAAGSNMRIQYNKTGTRFLVQTGFSDSIWIGDPAKFEKTHSSAPEPGQLQIQPPKNLATLGVAFAPDGQAVLFCNKDGKITEIDLATAKEKSTYDIKATNVYNIVFNTKGDRLLVGCFDGNARLYSFPDCTELQRLQGCGRVQISPEGKIALTFTKAGRMMLWNLER